MTKFDELYGKLYGRISDYESVDYDEATRNGVFWDLLMNAIDDFAPVCKQDLYDYDVELMRFNITLSGTEKDILTLYMMYHWIEPRVINSDVLRNALNTKDFSLYSPANLLDKMTALMQTTESKAKKLVNLYSFRGNDIAGLTK